MLSWEASESSDMGATGAAAEAEEAAPSTLMRGAEGDAGKGRWVRSKRELEDPEEEASRGLGSMPGVLEVRGEPSRFNDEPRGVVEPSRSLGRDDEDRRGERRGSASL